MRQRQCAQCFGTFHTKSTPHSSVQQAETKLTEFRTQPERQELLTFSTFSFGFLLFLQSASIPHQNCLLLQIVAYFHLAHNECPSQQRAAPLVTCYFPLRDIINTAPQSDHGSVHISIPKHLLQPAGCPTHYSMTTNKPPSRLSRKTAGTVKSTTFRLTSLQLRLPSICRKEKEQPTDIQTKKEILLSSLQITLIPVKAQPRKKSQFKSASPPPAFGFFLVYNLLWILEAIDSS